MKPKAGGPPQEVRLLGGQWKRSKLPVADRPGLRPTPSRVRETLFNWLGQDLTGWRVLDAFAGSGALGFEAASRGAREVLLVEQDLVFLDPPFDAVALFEPALRAAREAIGANGFVYLEAPRPWAEDELAALGLALHRHGRAGAVAFHLLRPTAP
jgi:16S rRNA (guanine966-N2)-methyltransferase